MNINAPVMNSLFVSFMLELCNEARRNNSRILLQSYTKALNSIKKYPLPLHSGKEALVLDGVGEYTAKKLDEMLESYLLLRSRGIYST